MRNSLDEEPDLSELFSGKRFDVEHALSLYAYSYVNLSARLLYEADLLRTQAELISKCHIYVVGFHPKVILQSAHQEGTELLAQFEVLGQSVELRWPLPEGASLREVGDGYFVEDRDGNRFWPNDEEIQRHLGRHFGGFKFDVQYVGQAFGKSGKRNAVERLLRHEKLQEIAVRGAPESHEVRLLLIETKPSNQLLTFFNPFAEERTSGSERITPGLEVLHGTKEDERVSLYEAGLIRYFRPNYNIEFKNSFPSTRMKILNRCYEKDISALIVELCFDDLPFLLCSEAVEPKKHHIAVHELHTDEARRGFFAVE